MEQRRKRGRPSKGDRRELTARLPSSLAEATQQRAAERGMTINDLLGELLAAETGTPYRDQERIPVT